VRVVGHDQRRLDEVAPGVVVAASEQDLRLPGLLGVIIICGKKMGAWGEINLVGLS
jgi:hypothetical protein